MIILDKESFLNKKRSDTIFVLGSGSSINNISQEEWNHILKFDSIGFNWFCHHFFGPTFYLIREQASTPKRNIATETKTGLIADLSKSSYEKTTLIVLHSNKDKRYNYAKNHHLFKQNGIILKDIKGPINAKKFRLNIFDSGVVHGSCTLTNIIHLIIFMGYRRVVFCGIDLNNSRYFWLPKHETRNEIRSKGLSPKSIHPTASRTMYIINTLKLSYNTRVYTANKDSMIRKIAEYKPIGEFL